MSRRLAPVGIAALLLICAGGCGEHASEAAAPQPTGFVLKAGDGEAVLNGLVVKASPATGTEGSILVEQTFQRGGTTGLHAHDQGDELFYVVSGHGTASLGDETKAIGPGDVIFAPRSAIHGISNVDHDDPLTVVFFMDSPELVEEFRAIHTRMTAQPDRPITAEEVDAIRERIGGSRRPE